MIAPEDGFQFTHPGRGATEHFAVILNSRLVSIHAPREGCDNNLIMRRTHSVSFNSRTPGGVRLHLAYEDNDLTYVSIHAPREGCDGKDGLNNYQLAVFQFTHPGRGATRPAIDLTIWLNVSIHAPREGCDVLMSLSQRMSRRFNSRTPGGVRPNAEALKRMREQFQFTHPGRGATGSSYR